MLKRLMVLGGMLAMLLAVAAPAMAQADKYQHSGTGILGEPYTVGQDPTLNYALTDEETGTVYELYSGFVHLAPYVGERVTFEGQQSQGLEPGPGDPVSVNVTSLEPVDSGPSAQDIVVITGALEAVAQPSAEGPTHTITEYSTGDVYGLFSDAQGVDLSQYEGQSVAIYGVFQTQGNPISDFADPTDVLIYVTSVESLEPLPVEPPADDQYENGGTTTDAPSTDDESSSGGTSSENGVMSVLPDTGGFSLVTLGLVAALLLGGGLLAYNLIRR